MSFLPTSPCTLVEENEVDFNYVYIRKGDIGQCCKTLLDALTNDPAIRSYTPVTVQRSS